MLITLSPFLVVWQSDRVPQAPSYFFIFLYTYVVLIGLSPYLPHLPISGSLTETIKFLLELKYVTTKQRSVVISLSPYLLIS